MCPLVDKSNSRCATHLTLANLSCAFAHCAGEYDDCPVYKEIRVKKIRPEPCPTPDKSNVA